MGYHRTSVADIAAKLGMSPANIYRFFPSRDAINEDAPATEDNVIKLHLCGIPWLSPEPAFA